MENKNVCQYCFKSFDGAKHKKTAEHIIPRGLIDLFPDQYVTFFEGKRFVDNKGMTVADVCKYCNGTLLSPLDSYGKNLIKTQFLSPIPTVENCKNFSYQLDYYFLSRWLLKILYNSQRAKNADVEWFMHSLGYMLYGVLIENFNFSIFAGLHVNTTPFPEDFYNYFPLQINDEPKIFGNSLSISALGIDPKLNSIEVQGAITFSIRMGTIVLYCILWDKCIPFEIRKIYDVLFEKEFSFIKIRSSQKEYALNCISAHSNTVMGYNHLVSDSGIKQDMQIVKSHINERNPYDVQASFGELMPPERVKKGRAFVEMAMFPNNKRIRKNFEKLHENED